jgi:hypothetical protein
MKEKGEIPMNRTKYSLYLLVLGVIFYVGLPVLAMTYEAPLGDQINHTITILRQA